MTSHKSDPKFTPSPYCHVEITFLIYIYNFSQTIVTPPLAVWRHLRKLPYCAVLCLQTLPRSKLTKIPSEWASKIRGSRTSATSGWSNSGWGIIVGPNVV